MQIHLNHLKATNVAASDEQTRYYLNGVYVNVVAQHVEYVATDGARLIAVRHELLTDSSCVWPATGVIIPSKLIERIKVVKKADDEAEATMEGGNVTIKYNGESYSAPAIDGTFPDWRRVVPDACNGEIAQFNASYLHDFSKAAKIMGHTIEAPIVSHNGNSAALVDFLGGSDGVGFGIIMPRRTGSTMQCPPWIRPQAETQAA
jgi:hypothetical protein